MSNILQLLPNELVQDPDYQAARTLALEAANAPIAEVSSQPVILISARPTGYWNNSGIYVRKGLLLAVSYVSGQWRTNPYWGPTGAAGSDRYTAGSTYLRPGAPEGSLIGKVGGDHVGGGSETFSIGNYGFVPPDLEGLLWLTANDEPKGFGDNSGGILVTVSVIS
ncbi:hypothetical protein NM213_11925 [Pseudomonas lactis]|uniref:hypothetical protein n=1 Tax=Pseudomonas TaxID=286 RepID=UPI001186F600|nr:MULTISPECIES: hypothetical protein [Pseudomonas]MDR8370604.1 hypothetical protein [Pseudomonas lactis]